MRVRQPDYLREPFRELSWKDRAFFVGHMALGVPLILLTLIAPFLGVWQLLNGHTVLGSMTVVTSLLIWVTFWTLNRY